jgi:Tetratricopeptide repeat
MDLGSSPPMMMIPVGSPRLTSPGRSVTSAGFTPIRIADKAEPLYKQSLALDETALGEEHPSLATRLNNLAELYRWTKNYNEAEPLYKRAVANVDKELGPGASQPRRTAP